jgi:hypothetical protein
VSWRVPVWLRKTQPELVGGWVEVDVEVVEVDDVEDVEDAVDVVVVRGP